MKNHYQEDHFFALFIARFARRFTLLISFICFIGTVSGSAAPGDLDASFGTGGKLINRPPGGAMTVQPDGKIVVVGKLFAGQFTDFAVMRYHPNGTPDLAFGIDGQVIVSITGESDDAKAVVIQPDGKIIVAGSTGDAGINRFAVARFNPNGTLDTTFSDDGKVTTAVTGGNSSAYAVALQSDGKIVVAGSRGMFASDFAVVRYNPDGSLDTGFDVDGQVVTPVGTGADSISAIAIQPDGRIVAAGKVDAGNFSDWGIVRYNPDGSLDANFGSGGKVFGSFGASNDLLNALVLQPDGKMVVAGGSQGTGIRYDFAVARFTPSGLPDATFDGDGVAVTPVRYSAAAGGVGVQGNGKIIAAGYSDAVQNGNRDFAVVRYSPNGSLDADFGAGGLVTTQLASNLFRAHSVVVQTDGRILVSGETSNDHAVVRYLGDAATPRRTAFDFDADGTADYAVFRPTGGIWYLQRSTLGFTGIQFGASGDKIVPADYDGDGKTDLAVYRSGIWYLNRSTLGFTGIQFGIATDTPVPADFDGDGKTDIAVFRSSNGTWYMNNLATNQTSGIAFGTSEDTPVPADFDGDGKADVAVFRPSSGVWYQQRSTLGFTGIQFGLAEDKPVPADFDADGKSDLAVFRPSTGTWYLQRSTLGFTGIQFGAAGDQPTAADYDGDGKTDIAVWRGSSGVFYVVRNGNQVSALQFGQNGDAPVAAAFVQ